MHSNAITGLFHDNYESVTVTLHLLSSAFRPIVQSFNFTFLDTSHPLEVIINEVVDLYGVTDFGSLGNTVKVHLVPII